MKLTKQQSNNLLAVLSILNYQLMQSELPELSFDFSDNEASLTLKVTTGVGGLIDELKENGFDSEYKEPHIIIEF
jgi:hypothetical protein